jgi:Tol biopolymer transport system component
MAPNGKYIVYALAHGLQTYMWRMEADGSNPRQLAQVGPTNDFVAFSADSKWLYYSALNGNNMTVHRISAEGGAPELFSPNGMNALAPAFSPDGKFLKMGAYEIDKGGWADYIYPTGSFVPWKRLQLPMPHLLVNWTHDSRGLSYALDEGGVGNIWVHDLATGKERKITNFLSDRIAYYAWSIDGKKLAISRGSQLSDAVMIENFR